MKKGVIFGMVAVTAATVAIAAALEAEFSADRIRAHVAFLADDTLEGRGPELAGMRSPPATSSVFQQPQKWPRR